MFLLLYSMPAVDEMGSRIDDLEKSISDLMEQAGIDANADLDEGEAEGTK